MNAPLNIVDVLFFNYITDDADDYDEEPEPEPEPDSLADMLNKGDEDDYYGYEEAY